MLNQKNRIDRKLMRKGLLLASGKKQSQNTRKVMLSSFFCFETLDHCTSTICRRIYFGRDIPIFGDRILRRALNKSFRQSQNKFECNRSAITLN